MQPAQVGDSSRPRGAVAFLGDAPAETDALLTRLEGLYTPIEEAVAELQRRRSLYSGRPRGGEWLPAELPHHKKGYAFLGRCIATPNFEMLRFLRLAGNAGLLPVIEEYHGDKFVAHNPFKHALGRLSCLRRQAHHGQCLVERINAVDWSQQGRVFRDVRTLDGRSLSEYHHSLLAVALHGKAQPIIYDCSALIAGSGGAPAAYYRAFIMRQCVTDGILFEDFLTDSLEMAFTRDIVLPAFEAVQAETGMKPLITRLCPAADADSPHWLWYPAELKAAMELHLDERALAEPPRTAR